VGPETSAPQGEPARKGAAAAAPPEGSSLRIKGEVSADDDLVLHGRVEGTVTVLGHVLTIGPRAEVSAEITARVVRIYGLVTGNVIASERFEIPPSGRMNGDVTSPSVVIMEGSEFTGRIDMRRSFRKTDGPPVKEERRRGSPDTTAS
jgi:cytoskeletal protein CcmA (bactofilin family)